MERFGRTISNKSADLLIEFNAGLVDVDWSNLGEPVATRKTLTLDGQVAFEQRFSF